MKKLLKVFLGLVACLVILIAYAALRVAMARVLGIENRSLGALGESLLVLLLVLLPMSWAWMRIVNEREPLELIAPEELEVKNSVPVAVTSKVRAKPAISVRGRGSERVVLAWVAVFALACVGGTLWVFVSNPGVEDEPWADVDHLPLTEEQKEEIEKKRLRNLAIHEARKVENERKERFKNWDKVLNPDEETLQYLERLREKREQETGPTSPAVPETPFFEGKPTPSSSSVSPL
jgi:hypothetical protein